MQTLSQKARNQSFHFGIHFWHEGWGLPWKTVPSNLPQEARPEFPDTWRLSMSVTDKADTERGGQRTVLADQAELPGALALQSALQVHGDVGLALLLQAVLRAWKIKGAGGEEEGWNSELNIEKTPHTGEKLLKHRKTLKLSRGPGCSRRKSLGIFLTRFHTLVCSIIGPVFAQFPRNKVRGRQLLSQTDADPNMATRLLRHEQVTHPLLSLLPN